MTAVESVGQLSFHIFELLRLAGPELAYPNSVDRMFSIFGQLLHAAEVENLSVSYVAVAPVFDSKRVMNSPVRQATVNVSRCGGNFSLTSDALSIVI